MANVRETLSTRRLGPSLNLSNFQESNRKWNKFASLVDQHTLAGDMYPNELHSPATHCAGYAHPTQHQRANLDHPNQSRSAGLGPQITSTTGTLGGGEISHHPSEAIWPWSIPSPRSGFETLPPLGSSTMSSSMPSAKTTKRKAATLGKLAQQSDTGSAAAYSSVAARDSQGSDDDYKDPSDRSSAKKRITSKQSANTPLPKAANKLKAPRAFAKNPKTPKIAQSKNLQAVATGSLSNIAPQERNTVTSTTDTGLPQNMVTGSSSKMVAKDEKTTTGKGATTIPRKQSKAIGGSSKMGPKKGNSGRGTGNASIVSEEQNQVTSIHENDEIDPDLYDKLNKEFQDEMEILGKLENGQLEYDGLSLLYQSFINPQTQGLEYIDKPSVSSHERGLLAQGDDVFSQQESMSQDMPVMQSVNAAHQLSGFMQPSMSSGSTNLPSSLAGASQTTRKPTPSARENKNSNMGSVRQPPINSGHATSSLMTSASSSFNPPRSNFADPAMPPMNSYFNTLSMPPSMGSFSTTSNMAVMPNTYLNNPMQPMGNSYNIRTMGPIPSPNWTRMNSYLNKFIGPMMGYPNNPQNMGFMNAYSASSMAPAPLSGFSAPSFMAPMNMDQYSNVNVPNMDKMNNYLTNLTGLMDGISNVANRKGGAGTEQGLEPNFGNMHMGMIGGGFQQGNSPALALENVGGGNQMSVGPQQSPSPAVLAGDMINRNQKARPPSAQDYPAAAAFDIRSITSGMGRGTEGGIGRVIGGGAGSGSQTPSGLQQSPASHPGGMISHSRMAHTSLQQVYPPATAFGLGGMGSGIGGGIGDGNQMITGSQQDSPFDFGGNECGLTGNSEKVMGVSNQQQQDIASMGMTGGNRMAGASQQGEASNTRGTNSGPPNLDFNDGFDDQDPLRALGIDPNKFIEAHNNLLDSLWDIPGFSGIPELIPGTPDLGEHAFDPPQQLSGFVAPGQYDDFFDEMRSVGLQFEGDNSEESK